MITIQNSEITLVVDPQGGQLQSIYAKGREYLWQGSEASWASRAPILFPVIARMRDGQYQVDGTTYTIPSHGFAKANTFTVTEQSNTAVTLTMEDSEETRGDYPFSFRFSVTFALEGNVVHKTHRVENLGMGEMYYEVGGHDGFNVPFHVGERMDDCYIQIPGLTQFAPYEFDDTATLLPPSRMITAPQGRIELKPATYGLDTVILEKLDTSVAQLVDSSGAVRLELRFPQMDYVALWTRTTDFDTNYVCIEPWTSLPDAHFVGRELRDKMGVRHLSPGESELLGYDIVIF